MALRRVYSEIRGKKVTELPGYIKSTFSMETVKTSVKRGLDNYNEKYIQTSSVDPILHICFYGMAFSYLVALPNERRHLEHQQHAKEHGGHWSRGNRFDLEMILGTSEFRSFWFIKISVFWINMYHFVYWDLGILHMWSDRFLRM